MSATTPPPGFIDLVAAQSAAKGTRVDVIGVVVDYMPPRQTYTRDSLVSFKLQDPQLRDATSAAEGLRVRFFKKRPEDLPPVKGVGDIVLLRAANVSEYAGEKLLMGGHGTAHLVFHGAVIPSPAFKLDYVSGHGKLVCQGTDGLRNTLGPVEQDFIITLKEEMKVDVKAVDHSAMAPPVNAPTGPGVPAALPPPPPQGYSRKFKLVKDLMHFNFADVCVEVVKKFQKPNGQCELYVTDYTTNQQTYYYAAPEEKSDSVRDGDIFGYNGPSKRQWPGPYGRMVFKVNLEEPHASYANYSVAEGEFIALENVKVKLMPNNNLLEGDMWPDQNNRSKVQVRKLHRSRNEISELLLRKSEYWASRRATLDKATKAETEAQAKPSKGQKKKLKKLQKAEEARLAAEREASLAEKKIQSNPHVRCTYKDQPLTNISLVLDATNTRHTNTLPSGTTYTLPFINARYHIKARVVDFHPPNLADFAVQLQQSDLEDEDDKSEMSADMTWPNTDSIPRWEWSFALQVEEVIAPSTNPKAATTPPSRMWLNVSHLNAQYLFGNSIEEEPTDLRENPTLLAKLREKLCILWGDLEEQKREEEETGEQRVAKRPKIDIAGEEDKDRQQPSNRPFTCCIEEYGSLREGGDPEDIADWEREFMMFGVTIS